MAGLLYDEQSMKNLFYLLLAVLTLLIIACEEKVKDATLVINPNSLAYAAKGGPLTLQIKSNTTWSVSQIPEWISISEVSGSGDGQLTVTSKLNETGLFRRDSFLIRTGDNSRVDIVRVSQSTHETANEFIFGVANNDEIVFNGATLSSDSIVIRSDIPWTIEAPEWVLASWNNLSVKTDGKDIRSGSGTLLLYTEENSLKDDRTGIVSIISNIDDKRIEIPVTQLGALNVKPTEFVVLANGFAFRWKYGCLVSHIFWQPFEGGATENDKTMEKALKYTGFTKASPDVVSSASNRKPATEYEICSLGTNNDGYYAEVSSSWIKTKTDIEAPFVDINSVSYDENGWHCTFLKNEKTLGYYVYYSKAGLADSADPYVAWLFKRAINLNPDSYVLREESGTYSVKTKDDMHVVTWGVDAAHELSGKINRYTCKVSDMQSSRGEMSSSKCETYSIVTDNEVNMVKQK